MWPTSKTQRQHKIESRPTSVLSWLRTQGHAEGCRGELGHGRLGHTNVGATNAVELTWSGHVSLSLVEIIGWESGRPPYSKQDFCGQGKSESESNRPHDQGSLLMSHVRATNGLRRGQILIAKPCDAGRLRKKPCDAGLCERCWASFWFMGVSMGSINQGGTSQRMSRRCAASLHPKRSCADVCGRNKAVWWASYS